MNLTFFLYNQDLYQLLEATMRCTDGVVGGGSRVGSAAGYSDGMNYANSDIMQF